VLQDLTEAKLDAELSTLARKISEIIIPGPGN
jgi:hypothetical protein